MLTGNKPSHFCFNRSLPIFRNNTEAANDIRRCIQFAEGKKKLLLVDNHKMVENITSNVEIVGEIKEILNKVGERF